MLTGWNDNFRPISSKYQRTSIGLIVVHLKDLGFHFPVMWLPKPQVLLGSFNEYEVSRASEVIVSQ